LKVTSLPEKIKFILMNPPVPVEISRFIKKHHVLVLSTVKNNKAWCSNCFYAYLPHSNSFVFTSDKTTRHIREAEENPLVAGSIFLETSIVGKIQGIQFEGILSEPQGKILDEARFGYLKRFPFAVLMNTQLWLLEITHIKLTDNRLGFGTKMIWNKEQEPDKPDTPTKIP
jgi:uncharacterized protein